MISDLVTADWLFENINNPYLRMVDCRWLLGQPEEGRHQYENGHIPGAVHLDVEKHLSGKEGPGRHPLPQKRDFQKILEEIGVSREMHVIAYDAGTGMPAPRLWWLLRYYGHERVSILDGGWRTWTTGGKPVEYQVPHYPKGEFVARAKLKWLLNQKGVDDLRDNPEVVLLDVRTPERYRGEVEPIDARAGHIPGAVNLPFTQLINQETGCFLPAEQLKEMFAQVGATKADITICYCGSGITACTNIFALRLVGVEAKLYEGSWGEWSQDLSQPIVTG